MKNLILIFLILATSISAYAANIGDDVVNIGQKGSTTDKALIFRDANSTQLGIDHTSGDGSLSSNKFILGDGVDSDTVWEFDIGLGANNPAIRWDLSDQKFIQSIGGSDKNISSDSSSVVTKATTATLATVGEEIVMGDATGAAFTINLPTAIGNKDLKYLVKKDDTGINNITLDAFGAQTIGGKLTRKMYVMGDYIEIISDNVNWKILDRKATVFVFANGNSSQVISASTEDMVFSVVGEDTTGGAWTDAGNNDDVTAKDSFLTPDGESGEYMVTLSVRASAGTSSEIHIYIDGSFRKMIGAFAARSNGSFSAIVRLEEGELMTIRNDIVMTLNGATNDHHIAIRKMQ